MRLEYKVMVANNAKVGSAAYEKYPLSTGLSYKESS
jgi:hypothetical protein